MGLRFRRSVPLLPGVKINLSKTGASLSLGKRGMSVNIGKKGTRTTVGLPGSGLSYSTYRPHTTEAAPLTSGHSWLWPVLGLCALVALAVFYAN